MRRVLVLAGRLQVVQKAGFKEGDQSAGVLLDGVGVSVCVCETLDYESHFESFLLPPKKNLPNGADDARQADLDDALLIVALDKVGRGADALNGGQQLGEVADDGAVVDGEQLARSAQVLPAEHLHEEGVHDGWRVGVF